MLSIFQKELYELLENRLVIVYIILLTISYLFTISVFIVGVVISIFNKETIKDDLKNVVKRLLSLLYYSILSFGLFFISLETWFFYFLIAPLVLHILYEFANLGDILGNSGTFLFSFSRDLFKKLYDKLLKKIDEK